MNRDLGLKDFGKIVVFDTETTGIDTKTSKPIELGYITLIKDDTGKFNQYEKRADVFCKVEGFNPETNVIDRLGPDGKKMTTADLTHITMRMLSELGKTEKEVIDEYVNIFNTKENILVLAYNANYDLCLMRNFVRTIYPNFEYPENAIFIDVMAIYKDNFAYDKEEDENGQKFGHRLDSAVKNLKVEIKNTHRAIDDVDATWEVFKKLMQTFKYYKPYYNTFGYNGRYGVGEELPFITYLESDMRGNCSVKNQSIKLFYKNA